MPRDEAPARALRATIAELDRRRVWHPYTPMDEYAAGDPLVIARAEGSWLYDYDGRRYLDANGSWWVAALGHRHPRLLRALAEQSATLAHVALGDATHEPAARLADELCALAPGADDPAVPAEHKLGRVFFSDDGSTAVEVAVQAAAQYWSQNGRPERVRFVTLSGGFHGETLGARAVGGMPVLRRAVRGLLFDVVTAPAPARGGDVPGEDPARAHEREAAAWERAAGFVTELLAREGDSIAGVIVEPVLQGVAGMRVYDPALLRALREATRRADTFLVADEVFTGLYRTGARFACDLAGVTPDFLCLAKALSGGLLPFGATLATERVFDGFRGDRGRALLYGHSYCGNPLGAAVAREVLAVLRDEDVPAQVARKAPRIAEAFRALERDVPGVFRARSLGMAAALDLGAGGYLADAGWRAYEAARARGVYLRPLGDTVYIVPPLTISDDDLELLLRVVGESVRAALGHAG